MTSLLRCKLTVIPLLLYWPAIFLLTHIPIPQMVIKNIRASDKTLHYLGYLILVFLMWFAISPEKKVSWCRAYTWWALFVMVVYGAVDEWLQGYVGRDADVMDFLANSAGVLTGLILLSIFPFWPASLVLTGAAIFVLTNFIQANITDQLPIINTIFHIFAYGLFSLLWVRYMHYLLPIRAPQPKWLIGALALPTGFLLAIELFSTVSSNNFRPQDVIVSAGGIVAIVATIFLTALFRRRATQRFPSGDIKGPV